MKALVAVALVSGAALSVATVRRALIILAGGRYELPERGSAADVPISIVCSCRNVAANVPGLVGGLRRLDYPDSLLRVVLVDDGSVDGTGDLLAGAAALCANWTFTRLEGEGLGKAGALGDVITRLATTDGVVLVLDSDHIVETHALYRMLDYFVDVGVAAVTFRHAARNREASSVSRYCALEGAVTEQVTARGQDALNAAPNLAGVWAARWSSLDLYGGPDRADDAVFAGRLAGAGSRVRYAADVITTHVVPDRVPDYLRQHVRWSSALYASVVKLTPPDGGRLLRRLFTFVDAVLTRVGYLERPLAFCCLLAGALIVNGYGWAILLPLAVWAAVVTLQIGIALRRDRYSLRDAIRTLACLYLIPVDAAATVWGFIQAFRRRRPTWD